jgi:hypothetical protein
MNTPRRILVVPIIGMAIMVGMALSASAQPLSDANKLATIAQVLQKLESRQSFTVVSDGKTIKWGAGPKTRTRPTGDATAQQTARTRSIRRLVLALTLNTAFVFSADPLGTECACMCASATDHKWDCDPAGCSDKHGQPC